MRQAKTKFFVFSFFPLTNSLLWAKEPPGVTPELRRIEFADAEKDFNDAIKKGTSDGIAGNEQERLIEIAQR